MMLQRIKREYLVSYKQNILLIHMYNVYVCMYDNEVGYLETLVLSNKNDSLTLKGWQRMMLYQKGILNTMDYTSDDKA